ncbi:ArsR/SmtB family transcription factor [Nocardia pseudobrasiliensis]|uniref:ArsR family transcriptional regulator n=1 Tax=Nocardia pseudobrasiliensis TaxID=45979 RepID=A0A370I2E5_9NOCA|nr:helix-turn-helix transcriptional regulator [Nocardia pseudobrasiliensis]RDI64909.1 ArsR family transcriptional regulator [Nocardia pseudobrasiliensis]
MTDTHVIVESFPVGSVQTVLSALQDPVRLEMVRRLSNAGEPMRCGLLYDTINKSTATHHLKTLREAGITERIVADGHTYARLRTEEVDREIPGLLDAIVGAANRAHDGD